jgi:hypothetical protein
VTLYPHSPPAFSDDALWGLERRKATARPAPPQRRQDSAKAPWGVKGTAQQTHIALHAALSTTKGEGGAAPKLTEARLSPGEPVHLSTCPIARKLMQRDMQVALITHSLSSSQHGIYSSKYSSNRTERVGDLHKVTQHSQLQCHLHSVHSPGGSCAFLP